MKVVKDIGGGGGAVEGRIAGGEREKRECLGTGRDGVDK